MLVSTQTQSYPMNTPTVIFKPRWMLMKSNFHLSTCFNNVLWNSHLQQTSITCYILWIYNIAYTLYIYTHTRIMRFYGTLLPSTEDFDWSLKHLLVHLWNFYHLSICYIMDLLSMNNIYYPLVNIQKAMEHHHFWRVNPLFLWPFSIATLNYQRVILVDNG